MNQFKDVFPGRRRAPYKRAVDTQKCIRVGGKHNDLEEVGYTYHHTFFEMLGNWSFGDYFKEEAIPLAWELLTKHFGLDPKRLLVTVFHDDEDAYRIWRKVAGISDDRIIRIATTDNFWEMGETGPCGPCSEILLDRGAKIAGGPPGSAGPGRRPLHRALEHRVHAVQPARGPASAWRCRPLVDTGMGFERMSAVLQGVQSNYDTDLFKALICGLGGGDRRARPSGEHLRRPTASSPTTCARRAS